MEYEPPSTFAISLDDERDTVERPSIHYIVVDLTRIVMAARGWRCLLRNVSSIFILRIFPARDMERMSRPSTWFIASATKRIRTKRVGKQRGTFGEKSTEKGDLCKYRMNPLAPQSTVTFLFYLGRVYFSNKIPARFFSAALFTNRCWSIFCELSWMYTSYVISHRHFSSSSFELSVIIFRLEEIWI